MIEKWLKRLKLLRISKLAIIICLILSITFAAFTIYGNKVGNFVVSVNKKDSDLRLSEMEDLSNQTVRLTTSGINEQRDITFDDVNGGIPDNISIGMGVKNDKNNGYLAYSFYLINIAQIALDYSMKISISGVTYNLDKSIRIMVIENENSKWNSRIYAKEESTIEGKNRLEKYTEYSTIDFLGDKDIAEENYSLAEKGYIKYTVVIWIEGWDIDCNDSIVNGKIKLGVTFQSNMAE